MPEAAPCRSASSIHRLARSILPIGGASPVPRPRWASIARGRRAYPWYAAPCDPFRRRCGRCRVDGHRTGSVCRSSRSSYTSGPAGWMQPASAGSSKARPPSSIHAWTDPRSRRYMPPFMVAEENGYLRSASRSRGTAHQRPDAPAIRRRCLADNERRSRWPGHYRDGIGFWERCGRLGSPSHAS